jgi:hypothetical protein
MKRWLAPLTLAAALAAGSGTAVAAPPTPVDPRPFPLDCATFSVTAQLTGKGKTITLPRNRLIAVSANFRISLTGPSGKTASYVINGSTHVSIQPDGSQEIKSTGKNVIIVPAANGHPAGLFLTTGNVNYALNADGTEKRLFSGGKATDICALLAP